MQRIKYSLVSLAILSSVANADDKQTHRDESEVEKLVVTATPMNRSILESATPVSIISGEDLDNRLAPTLGETLKNVPGVHSTYFGPVASSPVIRGLDGPRIKVVQNGLDVSDVSRVGPDHVVSTEASTAQQIEVLRGPATLLYGSGAIGGVVNIVDNRLPRMPLEETSGAVSYLHDSVSSEDMFSLNLDGGSGRFAWHLDAFDRETDNVEIPGSAELGGDEDSGTLDNSFIDANGYTLGAGWIGEDTRLALSYGRLDSDYGIPGHGHGDHDEAEAEEDHDEHEEALLVFGRLAQDRYQALFDWNRHDGFVREFHWHNAYTDYTHREIEEDEVGTRFENQSMESRVWIKHQPVAGWEGVIGLNYVASDFQAEGEEAFTPPTETDTLALFILEEKRSGDLLWQLGARIEDVESTPDNAFFEHDDEHEEEEEHEELEVGTESFTAISLSAGVVWTLSSSDSVAFNYARSERAPSAAEMFSNGAHIGTSTFEVGAAFDIEAHEDGDFELVLNDAKIQKEVANNLDLTYRRRGEHVEFSASVFYNMIDDYLFQQDTGFVFESEHLHDDHEEGAEPEVEEEAGFELPVYLYRQQDATLYGLEMELDWHLSEQLRIDTYADFTRAKLDAGGNVPRIPPLRIGLELHYEADNWHAELSSVHYAKQSDTALGETETDGYTLVNASLNYYMTLSQADAVFYLKGNNLTDEEARVHSSFLKDVAPLPGRGFVLGTKISF